MEEKKNSHSPKAIRGKFRASKTLPVAKRSVSPVKVRAEYKGHQIVAEVECGNGFGCLPNKNYSVAIDPKDIPTLNNGALPRPANSRPSSPKANGLPAYQVSGNDGRPKTRARRPPHT
jgi:hypothetical protein